MCNLNMRAREIKNGNLADTADGRSVSNVDESSLLNREPDPGRIRARVARAGACDEGKKNDRPEEREILYRRNSSVNPYPLLLSDPFILGDSLP